MDRVDEILYLYEDVEGFADGGSAGQLVRNTVDGSRPGYGGKPILPRSEFVKLRIKYKKTHTNAEFAELLNKDWKPAQADFFHKENVTKRIKDAKHLFPDNFDYKGSHAERALTPEKYISVIGKEKYEKLKNSPTKLNDHYEYTKLTDEQKADKVEKTRQRNKNLSEEQILDRKEKAIVRRQSRKGYSFYKTNKAENLLWNDLLRTAKNKNGYFTFKGEAPVKGEYYNKVATENFVLVDKKGNEFKYSTLSDDITKHSGHKLDDVLRPYKQKEFLATEGLTKELNKLAGYKPGSPKSVFHTQHIEGIDKNPWKAHLTFADQNIKESASRKSFNADWKAATYVDENGKTKVRHNDVGKIGDANYKPGAKTAVNRYYKSLGPDIVAQIGKKPKGEIKTLIELLDKTGIKLTDLQKTKGFTLGSNLANVDADMFDFRKLPDDVRHIADITKRYAAQSPKFLSALKKAKGAGKWTGLALAGEAAFAAPFAAYEYKMGESPERMWGTATWGLAGETEQEELRKAVGERGYATKQIEDYGSTLQALETKFRELNDQNDPRGEKRQMIENMYEHTRGKYSKAYNMFVDDQGKFDKGKYDQALNNYTAGLVQIDKFKKQKQDERIQKAGGYENILQERETRNIKGYAGGGIAGIRRRGAIPPESGPQPQGLENLKYYVTNT